MANYAAQLQPELKVAYYGIVTVTTEPRLETVEMRNAVGALWPFLSDKERRLLHELELADETEHRYGPVYIPYTFLLDSDRRIHKTYMGWWYVGRPTVEEIRMEMRAVISQRPDWEYNTEWRGGL